MAKRRLEKALASLEIKTKEGGQRVAKLVSKPTVSLKFFQEGGAIINIPQ